MSELTLGRLSRITHRFPTSDAAAETFLFPLTSLLARVPGATIDGSTLHLSPQWPAGALPATALMLGPIAAPEIVFALDHPIDLALGGLRLRSGGERSPDQPSPSLDLGAQFRTLPMATLAERLAGQIVAIDHTGANLPASQVDDERWGGLVRTLGVASALYRYPDGEPWPFIIPATDAELAADIRTFAPGRTPKFELVHDRWAPCPVLQFALVTNLTREELEARFPDPFGVAFPDLGHLFRTVYVTHPWPGLLIRLDLTYRGPVTDWDTGEWLVTMGGRLR